MRKLAVLSALVVLCCDVGCTVGPPPALSKVPETVTWPALAAIQAPEINMAVHRNAEVGDVAAFKKTATDPKMAELVDNLEKEPIPSKWASPAREQAKKDTVAAYRSMIEMCQGNPSVKDVKDKSAELGGLRGKLTDPDLK